MPAQFYLSATRKSSGKTTLSIGLSAALTESGNNVQCFKKGPDYIDPLWLAQASRNPTYNLDYHTQTNEEILSTYAEHASDKDVLLVEGNKGLFDGVAADGSNSNAALAKLLNIPVLLVIDCEGMTRGIAPLLQGYQGFDDGIDYAGVILNKTGGSRHEGKLIDAVTNYTDLSVFGCLGRNSNIAIEERHLGLVPANEQQSASHLITTIASEINTHLDLAALLKASSRQMPKRIENTTTIADFSGLKIAIPRDSAFGFYYADDLAYFRKTGAEIIFFNSITDQQLPDADGLFIGGGFPETHASALAANQALRTDIRNAIVNGLPTYAECGGLMYLSRSITHNNEMNEMVGVIATDIAMHPRPQGRGYCRYQPLASHPWPEYAKEQDQINAHEFHYARMQNFDALKFAYQVNRGYGINGESDGLQVHNLLANFVHFRHTQSNPWVDYFLNFVKEHKGS